MNWLKEKLRKFWKIIVAVLIGGVALAAGTVFVGTSTQETDILKAIEVVQTSYYQTHGRYFQGLQTSKSIPTSDIAPDNLDVKPFYQTEKWSDFIKFPNKLPFQIEIHQYKGPKGDGYQVFFRDKKGMRSYGYGPDAQSQTFEIINLIPSTIATSTP